MRWARECEARGAGEITLQYFRKKPETSKKSDGSYVTIADRQAESYLRKRIAERFPYDGILGEEEGESQGTSGRRWILDPIDGTNNFMAGIPIWATLVALQWIRYQCPSGFAYEPRQLTLSAAAYPVGDIIWFSSPNLRSSALCLSLLPRMRAL